MKNNINIRKHTAGEPSRVVNFYFKIFEEQFDFLPVVENYFLHAMTELYDNDNNRLWVADENGKIVGSICIVEKSDKTAQLRLFGTHPSTRGKGIGKKLMQTAMDYSDERSILFI